MVEPSLGRIRGSRGTVHLRPLSMDLLLLLAQNAGRVCSKEEITRAVWGRRFLADSALTRLVAELRQSLGDDPECPRFIETIPKRGYRLIASVAGDTRPAASVAARPSIVVLPFLDMAREKDQEYFCDGLAEELTNALTRLRGLRVIARTSAFAFKGKAVDVREIGRQLDAGAVVEGGVQRSADRLRITVQLINTADGVHLWSERFDRPLGDLFAIQDEIAQAVVDALKVRMLKDEEVKLLHRHTRDPEAHDLYLKGLYFWGRRAPDAVIMAIRCFEQVLTRDPEYAPAHAALGECYCTCGFLGHLAPEIAFPNAEQAARRALAIEPASGEAHSILGHASGVYRWRWAEAESCFLRAEELSPSLAQMRTWHAILLLAMTRFDEAVDQIEQGWDLDPLSPAAQINVGYTLAAARRYEEALERCLKTVEMAPDFVLANFHLGRTYSFMGRYEEAIAPLEKAAPGFPMAMAALGAACAKLGRRDRAEKILAELTHLAERRYVGPTAFASLFGALGQIDRALEWYEKSLDSREGVAPLLNTDPSADHMRANPRFNALLRRLELPLFSFPR